jgi:4-hydroxy-4-methyl-2-oxoglutarate aldolase
MNGYVFNEIERPRAALLKGFAEIGVATAHEGFGGPNLMDYEIRPLKPRYKVAGPAITCASPRGDNLMVHVALSVTQPGDILVIDGGGYKHAALWGANMTKMAVARKLSAVIVDGVIRDSDDIQELDFPIWSRGIYAGTSKKEGSGWVNAPIRCGGLLVYPGDIIIADNDGVAVIPLSSAEEVLERGQKRYEFENEISQDLLSGTLLLDLLSLRGQFTETPMIEVNTTFRSWIKKHE